MHHREIDERSFKFDEIISARLQQKPELLIVAKENIRRWLRTASPTTQRALLEWQTILEEGLEKTLQILADRGENSTRLRQSSPFAGEQFITRAERERLLTRPGRER